MRGNGREQASGPSWWEQNKSAIAGGAPPLVIRRLQRPPAPGRSRP
jgi:hypothetical protein